jgi:hypothetical protein
MTNSQTTKIPHWYISKTLMGFGVGEADRNKPILTHHDTHTDFVFNDHMGEWHDSNNKALVKLCDYLNQMEAAP